MREIGRVSGERFNRIVEGIVKSFWEREQFFEKLLLEDGYPPFHEPMTELQQYEALLAWRAAGDPRYWHDAEAQAALAELEPRFGRSPVMPLEPML